ncbi:MAG TPA: hypothetical protein VHG89_13015 [Verrucomicrobiae bacterium]|nr:hypothetical protein [Verrucomicrobiae bacterium]
MITRIIFSLIWALAFAFGFALIFGFIAGLHPALISFALGVPGICLAWFVGFLGFILGICGLLPGTKLDKK